MFMDIGSIENTPRTWFGNNPGLVAPDVAE